MVISKRSDKAQDSDGDEKLNPGDDILKEERNGLGNKVQRMKEWD